LIPLMRQQVRFPISALCSPCLLASCQTLDVRVLLLSTISPGPPRFQNGGPAQPMRTASAPTCLLDTFIFSPRCDTTTRRSMCSYRRLENPQRRVVKTRVPTLGDGNQTPTLQSSWAIRYGSGTRSPDRRGDDRCRKFCIVFTSMPAYLGLWARWRTFMCYRRNFCRTFMSHEQYETNELAAKLGRDKLSNAGIAGGRILVPHLCTVRCLICANNMGSKRAELRFHGAL